MPVTLEEASRGAQTDLDTAVIDEFRKSSALLDGLIFDDVVNPAGGNAVLTYGYRRLATQASAAFRQLNTEYIPGEVITSIHVVTLAPLGGSFQIDRVIARVGAPGETSIQMSQKIKATQAKFNDAVINGDTAVEAYGFDGLDKALSGSSTEIGVGTTVDWSDFDTDDRSPFKALDVLDEFLGVLDGAPTFIIGNQRALARVRAMARRAGRFVRNPIDGLLGPAGRPIEREQYGDVVFIDAGEKAGSNQLVIPIRNRDLNGAAFTQTLTGIPTGGTFTLSVNVQGAGAVTTAAIAYNASNADIKDALEALSNVAAGDVTVTGTSTKTISFAGTLRYEVVALTGSGAGLTGGTAPAAQIADSGSNATVTGLTDIYAVRVGLDGFHAVTTVGDQIARTWLPDFTSAGAVKTGEVELGPVAVALKATKAAAVLRNIKV
jgi:hypothetical protein